MTDQLYGDIPGIAEQEIAALKRQRIAEAMMAQAQEQVTPYQQAGRYVVPMHWTQGVAKLMQALMARRKDESSRKELASIADTVKKGREEALSTYESERATDPKGAVVRAMMNPYATAPMVRGAGIEYQGALQAENDKRDAEARALLEADKARERADLEAERIAARKEIADQSDQTRRDIAAMAGSMRQPPAPTMSEVVDPNDPSRMLRIDARLYKGGSVGDPGVLGVSGKTPEAAKAAETRGTGRESVTGLVTGLRSYYDTLNKGSGIVSTKEGGLSNVVSRIQSSGAGQFVGGAVGTENQQMRDQIKQQRPLLLNAIRQATGMSAKAMDSNVELQMYLQAATDPTIGYEANMSALDKIEELYGQSAGGASAAAGAEPPAAAGAPPAGVDPALWNAMTPEERALWP